MQLIVTADIILENKRKTSREFIFMKRRFTEQTKIHEREWPVWNTITWGYISLHLFNTTFHFNVDCHTTVSSSKVSWINGGHWGRCKISAFMIKKKKN